MLYRVRMFSLMHLFSTWRLFNKCWFPDVKKKKKRTFFSFCGTSLFCLSLYNIAFCFSICYVNIDVSKGPILKLSSLCYASSTLFLIISGQSIGRNLETSISSTDFSKANSPVFHHLIKHFHQSVFQTPQTQHVQN